MMYLAFALMYSAGIAGFVYLVLQGHPFAAFGVFLLVGGLSMTNDNGKAKT